ncbi:MAG: hypothetical protein QM692_12865 [Thermomicrobiales bacterium]
MVEPGIAYVRVVAASSPHALEDAINMTLEMESIEGAAVVDVRITGLPLALVHPRDGHGGPTATQHVALILLRAAS